MDSVRRLPLLAVDDPLPAASSTTQPHQQVALGTLNLPNPFTLAAGDEPRRIWPVNTRPLL